MRFWLPDETEVLSKKRLLRASRYPASAYIHEANSRQTRFHQASGHVHSACKVQQRLQQHNFIHTPYRNACIAVFKTTTFINNNRTEMKYVISSGGYMLGNTN